MKNLKICSHPLCFHNLSIIRDKNTNSELFRTAIKRLSYLLFYNATGELELMDVKIETPVKTTMSKVLDTKNKLILAPILRAGLIFSDIACEILPTASIQHIGMYRDEKTLSPVWYLDKTPEKYENAETTFIFLLDPMLATGNSALEAINLFINKGIPEKNIKFINLICSPEGVRAIHSRFSDVEIITASLDECLNEKAYIVPGLGDAGDRMFNTGE